MEEMEKMVLMAEMVVMDSQVQLAGEGKREIQEFRVLKDKLDLKVTVTYLITYHLADYLPGP